VHRGPHQEPRKGFNTASSSHEPSFCLWHFFFILRPKFEAAAPASGAFMWLCMCMRLLLSASFLQPSQKGYIRSHFISGMNSHHLAHCFFFLPAKFDPATTRGLDRVHIYFA
jgi:hypothetical protein